MEGGATYSRIKTFGAAVKCSKRERRHKEETKNILCYVRGRVRCEFLAEFICYRLRLCTLNLQVMYMRDQL